MPRSPGLQTPLGLMWPPTCWEGSPILSRCHNPVSYSGLGPVCPTSIPPCDRGPSLPDTISTDNVRTHSLPALPGASVLTLGVVGYSPLLRYSQLEGNLAALYLFPLPGASRSSRRGTDPHGPLSG